MSWLYAHKPESMSIQDFLARKLKEANAQQTAYLAVRYRNEKTQTERVGALICRLQHLPEDYVNLAYELKDETLPKTEAKAPTGILALLTPTDNLTALQWRARCWLHFVSTLRFIKQRL